MLVKNMSYNQTAKPRKKTQSVQYDFSKVTQK